MDKLVAIILLGVNVGHMPIKYLTRVDVEKMAEEAGMASFARLALLEADFLGVPVRFLMVGKKLFVQKVSDEDPED